MITPDEARTIAEANPNPKILEYIKYNEESIEKAAKNGRRESLLCSQAHIESELVRHFRERGFGVFKERKWCGCWQEPTYYIHW
jgi:hypothetical protein